jgi:hypothetical protein
MNNDDAPQWCSTGSCMKFINNFVINELSEWQIMMMAIPNIDNNEN